MTKDKFGQELHVFGKDKVLTIFSLNNFVYLV